MVLGRLPWKCALVYINNVKIYSRGFEAHVNNLCNIFARIRAAGLKLKCIGLSKLVYLGYVASAVGLRPNLKKIQAVATFPCPTNLECAQSFIGFVNHYQQFVWDFTTSAAPIYRFMKRGVTFTEGTMEQTTFEHLKLALCSTPLPVYPDFLKSFILQIDSSKDAIGAIISQNIRG